MGKIFKALEKSEKENSTKSTPQSMRNYARPKIKSAESSGKTKPAVQVNYHQARMPVHSSQEPTRPKLRLKSNEAENFELRTTDFVSPTFEETIESFVERNPSRRLEENNSLKSKIQLGLKPKERFSENKLRHKREPERQIPESENIAFLYQGLSEPSHPVQQLKQNPDIEETIQRRPKSDARTSGKRVEVQYSRTMVQVNDPRRLRHNKVLSAFEDMETSNEFKILRTQVLKRLNQIGGNCILVTSANPCEGKTFTSINLGVSIAKEFDRTVLIIDADIRRPAREHTDFSTEFFSLNVYKGLTDYLAGDARIEDILINPGIDKLTLIPGGIPVDNSPELLNSIRMETMMLEIKSRYPSDRLVIVDGPAFLHFPDATILCRYVDGVLPVIETERTTNEDAKKMLHHLKEFNMLGVVMNKNKS